MRKVLLLTILAMTLVAGRVRADEYHNHILIHCEEDPNLVFAKIMETIRLPSERSIENLANYAGDWSEFTGKLANNVFRLENEMDWWRVWGFWLVVTQILLLLLTSGLAIRNWRHDRRVADHYQRLEYLLDLLSDPLGDNYEDSE